MNRTVFSDFCQHMHFKRSKELIKHNNNNTFYLQATQGHLTMYKNKNNQNKYNNEKQNNEQGNNKVVKVKTRVK